MTEWFSIEVLAQIFSDTVPAFKFETMPEPAAPAYETPQERRTRLATFDTENARGDARQERECYSEHVQPRRVALECRIYRRHGNEDIMTTTALIERLPTSRRKQRKDAPAYIDK